MRRSPHRPSRPPIPTTASHTLTPSQNSLSASRSRPSGCTQVMIAPAELQTERLTLRMLRESDLDAYAEMCGDAQVMRYLGDGKPMDRGMAWRNLALMLGHWSL